MTTWRNLMTYLFLGILVLIASNVIMNLYIKFIQWAVTQDVPVWWFF